MAVAGSWGARGMALAERADRPLRGAGQNEWLGRLQAEAGNLAAAVRWYLAHDPAPLPHLFGVLLPVWALQDDVLGDARSWIGQLLPAAGSLDPQARAELLWAAAVTAREVDDDQAALAARERLGQALETIGEPYLRAVSQLAMAAISAVTGQCGGALREASVSLEDLRGQDEPYWTALALLSVGSLETVVGRYDDALRHLIEMRDLVERFGNTRLIAASRVQLGTLAIARGQLDQARTLLEEGLDLSMALRMPRNVTLSLAAFAQLAFAEGNPDQATLLAGAAGDCAGGLDSGMADSKAAKPPAGHAGPRDPGRRPIRPGVRRRLRAQPAAGRGRRPRSTAPAHRRPKPRPATAQRGLPRGSPRNRRTSAPGQMRSQSTYARHAALTPHAGP